MSEYVLAGLWENELVERIGSLNLDAAVHVYPNDARGYFVKHKNGEVLVRYNGSQYNDPDASLRTMERIVNMEITLVFRRLRDASGLYDVVEKVCGGLLGYRLSKSTSGIMIGSDDFIAEDEGMWQFGIKLHFKSYLNQL